MHSKGRLEGWEVDLSVGWAQATAAVPPVQSRMSSSLARGFGPARLHEAERLCLTLISGAVDEALVKIETQGKACVTVGQHGEQRGRGRRRRGAPCDRAADAEDEPAHNRRMLLVRVGVAYSQSLVS